MRRRQPYSTAKYLGIQRIKISMVLGDYYIIGLKEQNTKAEGQAH